MTNIAKVDKLIQYILLVAGQEDDLFDRQLGPIHLIKYLYLADLSHAESHNGKSYTGLPWRFHHYGPYCEEVLQRIEPALISIGADKRIIESTRYEDDFIRWSKSDDELCDQLFNELDLSATGAINRQVHQFGKDTSKLLDFAYKTKPMLHAAPGDSLDFSLAWKERKPTEGQLRADCQPLTRRQEKKRAEQLSQLKLKLRNKLDTKKKTRFEFTLPRYDGVFFKGIEQLDDLAGEKITPEDYQASFSEEVWKSKTRYDPDLSG